MKNKLFYCLTITAVLTTGCASLTSTAKNHFDGFVLVKGGSFEMGDCLGDGNFAMSEIPIHKVQVDDFLLAKYEVTVGQFRRFVEDTGYKTLVETSGGVRMSEELIKQGKTSHPCWKAHWFEQNDKHPVVWIAWEDAIAYCNWLSRKNALPPAYNEKTGQLLDANGTPTSNVRRTRGFRLPTEAEWEFAARERGRKVRFGNGRDIARANEMNFDANGTGQAVPSLRLPKENSNPYNEKGNTVGRTTEVGSYAPNALMLYDMSGNAWEWCTDTGGAHYTEAAQVNPCKQGAKNHIVRGGTYDTDAKACRASARIDWYNRSQCPASGFRVALTIEN
jgi:sulfatase modifying factor 1